MMMLNVTCQMVTSFPRVLALKLAQGRAPRTGCDPKSPLMPPGGKSRMFGAVEQAKFEENLVFWG